MAQATTTPSTRDDRGILTSLEYYENVVANAGRYNISRPEGSNLDVLSLDGMRNNEEDEDHNNDNTIAVCHLSALNEITEQDASGGGMGVANRYEELFAIALAAHHLNVGDGSLVPAVQGLNERCHVRFTLQDVVDTQTIRGIALDHVIRQTSRTTAQTDPNNSKRRLPCVFVGSYRSALTIPTSMITGIRGYPQISMSATSKDLDDKSTHPLFARSVASDYGNAYSMLQLFGDVWQVRHLAVLHIDDPYGNAYASGIKLAIKQHFQYMTVTEVVVPNNSQQQGIAPDKETIQEVIESLKISQFRYIFAILFDSFDEIMTEAYRQGIAGTGQHNWVFSDSLEPGMIMNRRLDRDSIELKTYSGVGFLGMSGGIPGTHPSYDKYVHHMNQLNNPHDVEFLQSKTPQFTGLYQSEFLNPPVGGFTPFAYDATIALGLATCEATTTSSTTTIHNNRNTTTSDNDGGLPPMMILNGTQHYHSLVHQDFMGVTGRVVFDPETGSRDPTTYLFKLVNFVPVVEETSNQIRFQQVITNVYQDGEWTKLSDYMFNDGTTTIQPDLPPLNLDENFLSTGTRVTVLLMCSVVLALATGFGLWTVWNHSTKVVRASQPFFLYILIIGSTVLASTIIPLSYDRSTASAEGCDLACIVIPWLTTIGFSLIFAALWAKTYRINKIVNNAASFRRITVTIGDVARPMVALLAINVLVLILWTALAPPEWEIVVLREDRLHGEPSATLGRCRANEEDIPYMIALLVVNLATLCIAIFQAYKARNLSTEFAESQYIFKASICILLVWFVGGPVLLLANDDADIFIFVASAIVFVISTSTLLWIFVPKVQFARQAAANTNTKQKSTHHVSGLHDDCGSTGSDTKATAETIHSGEEILSYMSQIKLALENEELRREIKRLRRRVVPMEKDEQRTSMMSALTDVDHVSIPKELAN